MLEIGSDSRSMLDREIVGALSFLDDWSSLVCRSSAAKFLHDHPHALPKEEIGRLWLAIYEEQSTPVVVSHIETLGAARAFAKVSAPLLIHHLLDKRPQVARVAAEALVTLAPDLGNAILPFLSAPLIGDARNIRDAFCSQPHDSRIQRLNEASLWAEATPYRDRCAWLQQAYYKGCFSLNQDDWCRFLALMCHSRREHTWSCVRLILFPGREAPSQDQISDLAACGASFFGQVIEDAEPISARFLAQTLLALRPYTASLAYPLSRVDINYATGAGIKVHGAALQMYPELPALPSLHALTSLFWEENEHQVRDYAIVAMENVASALKGPGAQELIYDVREYIKAPPNADKSLIRRIGRIVCQLPEEDARISVMAMAQVIRSSAPKDSKIVALSLISSLHHTQESLSLAKIVARERLNSPDRGIAMVAKNVLIKLDALERSLSKA